MKRYLVLILTATLLLPMLVVPIAVTASKVTKKASPAVRATSPVKTAVARQRGGEPVSMQAVGFAESIPLRDLPDAAPPTKDSRRSSVKFNREELEREMGPKNKEKIRNFDPNFRHEPDGALREQSLFTNTLAPQVLPTPSVVFDGVSNLDNFTLFGGRVSPPDTNGDVGPNHYVQVVNLAIRIFDKSGNPLTASKKFSSIFTALSAPCGAQDDGDPIALYDPMADRWMLSQFCLPGYPLPPYYQSIAISKTPDPTGAYYLYNFNVGAGNNELNDYPHFGVWPDGYYMTSNQFLNGDDYDGGGMFAFDRQKMLVGDPTASLIYFNRNLTSFPEGNGGMLPADMDGVKPPPPGTPCPFAYFVANEDGAPRDGVRIFDFHADFATPANSTFIERAESSATPLGGIAVAAFDPRTPNTGTASRTDIPQPAPATAAHNLDAISDRFMYRLQYVNFGSHESLAVTHSVNVGTGVTAATYRSGVRYYEFRKAPGAAPYVVQEQGTFAPADGVYRWMGSAALNAAGDLAVGFSASSTSVFPSMRYAARFAADPAGSLAQGEQTLFAATGSQTSTGSRWGDYSNLSVDPSDDCSYWFTSETYTAASQATSTVGWLTKVAKFNLGSACTPFPKGTISGTVTACNTGLPVAGAVVKTNNGFFTTTDASGNYTLPKMSPDTVNVTITKAGFSSSVANNVAVTNGNTTTQNACISGISIVNAAGSQLVAESCPNGALDPGEVVTVNLTVNNTGALDTTNLVGTLQATGNVSNPPYPQTFGAVVGGGSSVTVPYTFRVNPSATCGSLVTLTLNLSDGVNNLGTAVYNFQTGVLQTILTQAFDTVTAPALPAGWVATRPVGTAALWVTNTTTPDSAPNSAFVSNPSTVSDNRLDSPSIPITTSTAVLNFKNRYATDTDYDGMVLEISITGVAGGAFQDILTAGGSFVTGGYNGTLNGLESNPLGARQAWTGTTSNLYVATKVNLPASAAGKNIVLRWRFGSGSSFSSTGARIDGITIQDGYACCTGTLPLPDLSGDGKADVAVYHPNAGASQWRVRNSLTGVVSTSTLGISTGPNPDKPVPADYDGNGQLDIAVWRPTDGTWNILNNPAPPVSWGILGDIPVPADYDGDRKADIAVYRPSENNWYIIRSTGGGVIVNWGLSTDKLVPADYDGDGKADVAIWRPSEGNWYIIKSSGGGIVQGWGISTDIPVPADYDGDGRADIAIYRPLEGNWYVIKSNNGSPIGQVKNWGISTDTPVPADYDGDRKADFAVWRGSDGNWYVVNSGGAPATSLFNLGQAGDTPISKGVTP